MIEHGGIPFPISTACIVSTLHTIAACRRGGWRVRLKYGEEDMALEATTSTARERGKRFSLRQQLGAFMKPENDSGMPITPPDFHDGLVERSGMKGCPPGGPLLAISRWVVMSGPNECSR
jgi:hypothetical protein